jgi:hypothetical protein
VVVVSMSAIPRTDKMNNTRTEITKAEPSCFTLATDLVEYIMKKTSINTEGIKA